jgi:hypothetical protein
MCFMRWCVVVMQRPGPCHPFLNNAGTKQGSIMK